LEESDLIPEKKSSKEDLSNNNFIPNISDEDTSKILDVSVESQTNIESKNSNDKKDTLFRRVIENGFDGITTNPNYKLLALLIILLINLSLFFVVGNIGKNFLRDSGILS
tara:strand:- start:1085 stop:1414 length:330 start_codon:yes stop_codon:yes gene_type:complete